MNTIQDATSYFVPNQPLPGRTDGVTAAEMQYWNEAAQKAPAILRHEMQHVSGQHASVFAPVIIGVALGAALSAVSFMERLKDKRIARITLNAAGMASTALGAMGSLSARTLNNINDAMVQLNRDALGNFANALENDPKLSAQFADYLSRSVSAEDAQRAPMVEIVAQKAVEFGQRHTKFFQPAQNALSMQRA